SGGRVPALDRGGPAGGVDRPADDRPRAAAHAGSPARVLRAGDEDPGGGPARPRRPDRSRRPPGRRLLGRHAAPPRPRAGARPPPAGPLPRRADDRPRSDQPQRPVARGARAQRRGHHGVPDDAVPRGGRAARRPRGDHRPRAPRRRGDARRPQGPCRLSHRARGALRRRRRAARPGGARRAGGAGGRGARPLHAGGRPRRRRQYCDRSGDPGARRLGRHRRLGRSPVPIARRRLRRRHRLAPRGCRRLADRRRDGHPDRRM
ncbi:MAG: Efflux ABC transporter, ATP-binding protein, partial [uncultured Solirubrobacteraceae bacterium]